MRLVLLGSVAAVWVAAQVGCGSDDAVFNSTGPGSGGGTTTTSASGGSGQGGTSTGQGGSTTSTGGGGGSSPGACAAAVAAAAAQSGVMYWSTLDDLASLTSPMVGNGAGAQVQTMPMDDFVPALSGQGLRLDDNGERAGIALVNNLDPTQGTVDFCYQPFANHTDDQNHPFLGVGIGGGMGNSPAFMTLRKAAANNMDSLQLIVSDGSNLREWAALGGDYAMMANQWYRITVSWNIPGDQQPEAHLYLDGVELTTMAPMGNTLNMPAPSPQSGILIGAVRNQNWHANGILDELVIYDAPMVP